MNYDESRLRPYVLFFKACVNSPSVEKISESLIRNPKGGGEYGEATSKGPQEKTQVGPGKICLNIIYRKCRIQKPA